MSVGSRPATCASCGKRLNRKSWYYRNGKYFCKKRCWVKEAEKAMQESAAASATPEPPKEPGKPEPTKQAAAAGTKKPAQAST